MGYEDRFNITPYGAFNRKVNSGFYITCNQGNFDGSESYLSIDFMYDEGQYVRLLGTSVPFSDTLDCNLDMTQLSTQLLSGYAIRFLLSYTLYGNVNITTVYTYSLNYNDEISAPTIVSPGVSQINTKEPVTFSWTHNSDLGFASYGYDLEYSYDNVSWTNLHSVSPTDNYTPAETQYTAAAGTFQEGTVYWRVRTYSTLDAASEYASSSFISYYPLTDLSIISLSNTPRLRLTWESGIQQAFQIIADGYDSGYIFGTQKEYIIPQIYQNGQKVTVSIRVKNRQSKWTEWKSAEVTVANIPPGTITLTAGAENAGIVLNWEAEGTFAKYYVLRDGEPIARTEETGYTDYFSVGESRYQVMGVDADGYCALSEEITLAPDFENGVISGVEPVDWIPLAVKRGNQPEFVSSHTESITYQYYSGRMLPVPYSSRFREVTRTLDFTVKLPAYRRLKELVGEIVIYKDYTGEKMIGVLNDLQTSGRPDRPDISASITAVDYSEVIPFD